ncbi:MFS permease [Pararobbsia alpina]|uniref:MFS transporter n=1 Tax=Pararobbsia alpina TaxID=621374 RepID=UPI0039A595A6
MDPSNSPAPAASRADTVAQTAPPVPPVPTAWLGRDFSLFWVARVASELAVKAESVAIGWQVYTVARRSHGVEQSTFLVGMIGLVQFVPLFVLALFAGALADRAERRRIVVVTLSVEVVCACLLMWLAMRPVVEWAALYGVAAVFGASRAFLSPAMGAMAPMLVPRHRIPQAVSWSSLGDQMSSIVGPWIGGALCAIAVSYAYAGAALLYAFATLSIVAVRTSTRPPASSRSHLELIREGLVYIRTHRVIAGALSLDLFAVLLGGATALLPVFASDILRIGAHGFGVLRSGPAIGAAVMAVILVRAPVHRHAGRWMFAGVAVFGAATLVFAASRSIWISLGSLVVLGAADMVSVYVRQSLVQVMTPDAMRGRVSAVAGLFIGASAELGEFETGVTARILGPVGAAVLGGLGSLAVTGVWAWRYPELRNADRLDEGG